MPANKNKNTNSSHSDEVNPDLLNAIRRIVREEIQKEVKNTKNQFEAIKKSVQGIHASLQDIEAGLTFTQKRLDDTIKVILPALSGHMTLLTEVLAKL